MSIENHYILLFVAVIVAEIIASVLARRFITTKNQIKFGEELMAAVNKARQDVLNASQVIEEMEAINLHLRKENQQLNAENLRLEKLAAQLKSQLHTALDDINYWQDELKKVFPNWPENGHKISNNNA